MRRVLLILAAAALMVVLAATTVSPAFAQPPEHAGNYGYAAGQDRDREGDPTHPEYTGQEDSCIFGHGSGQRPSYGDPHC